MQKLISLLKRIFEVISKNGGYTKYQIVVVTYFFGIFYFYLHGLIDQPKIYFFNVCLN